MAPCALARAGADAAGPVTRLLLRLSRASPAAGAVTLLAWLMFETAQVAGTGSLVATGEVLRNTVFGHIVLMQLAGLAAAAAVLGRGQTATRRWGPPVLPP